MTAVLDAPIMPDAPVLDEVRAMLAHSDDTPLAERHARGEKLSDPTALCCAVARSAVEAFHGIRPVHQLTQWLAPHILESLSARAHVRSTMNDASQGGKKPVRVVRARVERVSPIAAEATVVIADGPRVRAVALRVEEHRGRWRAVDLLIG
ncbi:Rv3235 family protein [Jonesia quinghaiensis]|uniref:Rv3235 family protein n=1 Tax=Jonesia quinghaiensis TaxID=262806 RepID=UPI0003FFDB77|nr:Rv3235 family protein [Jonesia quinghaiensis]